MTNRTADLLDDIDRHLLLEQYKLYVETSLNVTKRRNSANTYFLSINTFLFAALGAASAAGLGLLQLGWTFFVSVAGVVLCYYWFRLIQSYRALNKAKFAVIHDLESNLPAKLFSDEWARLGEGKDKSTYRPLTSLEMKIPWIFISLYSVLLIWSLLRTLSN